MNISSHHEKVAWFGENVTFVLRLAPAAIDSDTAMNVAHTQDNKQSPYSVTAGNLQAR